jgi:PKD repeat protein
MPDSRRLTRTLTLAAALVFGAACSDLPEPTSFDAPPQMSAAQASDIMAVQTRHTPELMGRDGIIGTGIRLAGREPSIVVYAVSASHAAAARVPARLEGYAVDVVVTGRIDATDYNNPTTKERPAPSGFSVGHPSITAGTIGAIVTDGTNTFILSNNHILANSNDANIGDAALQPGPHDGGTSADQIGTLHDFEVILMGGAHNTMDAAIALVPAASVLGATPTYAYGAPSSTIKTAALNMPVQKFGRTTGHTTGTVSEVNVTVSVCFVPRGMFQCAQAATFVNQVGVTPGSFSAGGDSGSLIVTNDSGKNPVALLFAGSSTRTLGNPIGPVLQRFGVSIGSGSGGGDDPPPPPPPPGDDTTPPSASFTVSCGNSSTCSFTDTSTDNVGVTSWSWNFGNGATSTQQHPSTTYTASGSYPVTLTVGDAAGNTATATQTVSCVTRGPNLRCS